MNRPELEMLRALVVRNFFSESREEEEERERERELISRNRMPLQPGHYQGKRSRKRNKLTQS